MLLPVGAGTQRQEFLMPGMCLRRLQDPALPLQGLGRLDITGRRGRHRGGRPAPATCAAATTSRRPPAPTTRTLRSPDRGRPPGVRSGGSCPWGGAPLTRRGGEGPVACPRAGPRDGLRRHHHVAEVV